MSGSEILKKKYKIHILEREQKPYSLFKLKKLFNFNVMILFPSIFKGENSLELLTLHKYQNLTF